MRHGPLKSYQTNELKYDKGYIVFFFKIRLSLNSIDMNTVISRKKCEFEYVEAHYQFQIEWN